jgi:hypothetical protein
MNKSIYSIWYWNHMVLSGQIASCGGNGQTDKWHQIVRCTVEVGRIPSISYACVKPRLLIYLTDSKLVAHVMRSNLPPPQL